MKILEKSIGKTKSVDRKFSRERPTKKDRKLAKNIEK